MSKKQIIFASIIVILVLGYGLFVFWGRLFPSSGSGKIDIDKSDIVNTNGSVNQKSSSTTTTTDSTVTISDESNKDDQSSTDYSADCQNKCSAYSNEEKEECLGACKDSEEYKDTPCDQRSGTDRDLCYKNEADEKQNDNICDKISDSKIKKECVNAVAEAVLDQL